MAQIPTPPPSRVGSEVPESSNGQRKLAESSAICSELKHTLDGLLEQYLLLLDQQQELHAALSKKLSSGFLALAHANYTCPPGRRYGTDYYDERMKATQGISIRDQDTEEHTNETSSTGNATPDQQKAEEKPEESQAGAVGKESVSPADTHDESEKSTRKTDSPTTSSPSPDLKDDLGRANDDSGAKPKKFRSNDPIHWYGILVPQSLRNAQKSFRDAVQTDVPELAGTIVEMRALEEKIAELRNKLGP
ncbi:hypothetical protein N7468_009101 [Penicillium chermesinum]|uniref:Vacuolar ATPase assembly protein VMA22 n=1 Tax=Penicillium chermesinum TaxID=63820 RepID=A0A9W9NH59_9EURO|nr:uncharacterized protein N7468_009101 [Penicillium chermesinum]KAJ5219897.1 hypothetical protein N7468_009101 [Penicillium chermesinum]KAJ6157356.1 hypothetical protein N7470_004948 [Penicillium chermesinum]